MKIDKTEVDKDGGRKLPKVPPEGLRAFSLILWSLQVGKGF